MSRYTPKNFGVAPPPPPPGRCRTEIWVCEKVSRYTGVSQLQLRVSRYTVQLRFSERGQLSQAIPLRVPNGVFQIPDFGL